MERILPAYAMVIAITFLWVLTVLRGNEPLARTWARVRVRVEESRGKGIHDRSRMAEPPEETYNLRRLFWLSVFGMMMLIYMLLNGA